MSGVSTKVLIRLQKYSFPPLLLISKVMSFLLPVYTILY